MIVRGPAQLATLHISATHIQEQRAAIGAGCQEAANLQLVAGADDAREACTGEGEARGGDE